jgi:transcriptional regulator with XRE-family HTH domain
MHESSRNARRTITQNQEAYLVSDTTNIFEETPDDDTTGGRLSRAREASGLTVKDLAWRLGVKIATVKAWESDRSQPSSHRLSNIAGLLKVSLSWIVHGVGIGPAEEEPQTDGDQANPEITAQLNRLRLLHVETGLLLERMKGEADRRASVA